MRPMASGLGWSAVNTTWWQLPTWQDTSTPAEGGATIQEHQHCTVRVSQKAESRAYHTPSCTAHMQSRWQGATLHTAPRTATQVPLSRQPWCRNQLLPIMTVCDAIKAQNDWDRLVTLCGAIRFWPAGHRGQQTTTRMVYALARLPNPQWPTCTTTVALKQPNRRGRTCAQPCSSFSSRVCSLVAATCFWGYQLVSSSRAAVLNDVRPFLG